MKWIKRLALIIAALLILLILAAVIVMAVFDPNDYKAKIQAVAEERTGRQVTLAGDIGWSIYPALGVDVADVAVSNAEGFGDEPQLQANELSLYVQLLPLLSGDIQVNGVALDGLVLNITRDESGKTNYDDLLEKFASNESDDEDESDKADSAPKRIEVSRMALTNARVVYDDQQAGERYELAELNVVLPDGMVIDAENQRYELPELEIGLYDNLLITGSLTSEKEDNGVQLNGSFALEEVAIPELLIAIMGEDASTADLPQSAEGEGQFAVSMVESPKGEMQPQRIQVTALGFDVDWQGESLSLSAPELVVDVVDETLAVDSLTLQGAGLNAVLTLQGKDLLSAYTLEGQVNVAEFSPRDFLQQLQIAVPELADNSVLQTASLQTNVNLRPESVAFSGMQLKVDETTATGSFSVTDLATMAMQGQLNIDRIDLDRYLPKDDETKASSGGQSAGGDDINQVEIPLDAMRDLQAKFGLQIDWLKVADMRFTQLSTQLDANQGLVVLKPLRFQSYQGQFDGYAQIDARSEEPTYRIESNLNNVAAADVQQDLLAKAYVSGVANLRGQLNTRGKTVGEMRRNLNGTIRPRFSDGAVLGVNMVKYLRQISVLLEGGSVQDALMAAATAEDAQTDFSLLTVGCVINNGVAACNDLDGKLPGIRLGGLGEVDLFAETLDYTVKISVVDSLQGQGGGELDELRGITVPVRCKGSWSSPSCKPDIEDILKAKVKEELQEQYEEKLQDKVEEKLEEELGEEGKEFIKGLFGR